MRFEVWQALMDELAPAFGEVIRNTGAMLVWRTTFMVRVSAQKTDGLEDGHKLL